MSDSTCAVSVVEPRVVYMTPEISIGLYGQELIHYTWQDAEICVIIDPTAKIGARGLFFKPTRSDFSQSHISGNLPKAPRHSETANPAPIFADSVGQQSMIDAGFCV